MRYNQSHQQNHTQAKARQQGKNHGFGTKIEGSRLLEMDLFSFRGLVEAAEEPMAEDDTTTDMLDEADADIGNDGAEIDDEAMQSSELNNDHSFDGIGHEETQVQLHIDSYWVLHAIEVNGKGYCQFYQPEWTRNCEIGREFVVSDLINRLNSIAIWLEKYAGHFLLNPSRASWHMDMDIYMADILAPGKMNQKGFVEAINNLPADDNLIKNKKMGEDYFSRIADKLLIVWPGKTAVKIKDLIESMKDDDGKKLISGDVGVSTFEQPNDNSDVLPDETVISPKQEPINKNEGRAIQYLLDSRFDQEKWRNLPLKKFITNSLGMDGRKHNKILKEFVEKLSDSDDDLSPVELFIKTAIKFGINASELEKLHENLVQSIE
ncbi:hypothetical protein [Methylobacter psychrophilus]|uniref:hypothetical protein n=1 Tax=Methylobacter psychrophilus TaxID=96941 RepID=UPI0021D49AFB|nr:hypothetical protein [Methylobacter psychrophilus]